MRNFLIYWLPVFFYALVIYLLSCISSIPAAAIPNIDILLHIVEYLILGFLLTRAINFSYNLKSKLVLSAAVALIAFVYGLSDEFHQMFVVARESSLLDAVSDGFGGLLGAVSFNYVKNKAV